jgi:hypothetical protein
MVVSDELIQRAWRESASSSDLEHFVNVGPLFVRGRNTPVHVWKLLSQSSDLALEDAVVHCAAAQVQRHRVVPRTSRTRS